MSGQHEAKKWVLRQWDQKKRKHGLISTRRRRKTVKTEEGGKDGEQERLPVRTAGTSVSHKSTPIVIVGVKVFFSLHICVFEFISLCTYPLLFVFRCLEGKTDHESQNHAHCHCGSQKCFVYIFGAFVFDLSDFLPQKLRSRNLIDKHQVWSIPVVQKALKWTKMA